MDTIITDPEFRNLIPAIADDELRGLEESILAEGCRDELIVWGNTLLDGHNRLAICEKHGIKYMVRYMDFPDRDAAKLWIICNQLGRRNITPAQRDYLIGIQQKIEKGGVGHPEKELVQNEPISTAEKIGRQWGVSASTVKRAEKFADAVDKLSPEEREEVLSGKSGKTKKEIVSGQNKKRQEGPTGLPKLGPPRNGMQFARIAIMNLEEIKEDDIERMEAFKTVMGWLSNKLSQGGGRR